jgi:hypothetical protein
MCPEKLDGPDGLAGAFQRRRKLSRLKLCEHKDSANDRNKPIEAMLKPVAGKVVQPKSENQERMKSATPWSKWSDVPPNVPLPPTNIPWQAAHFAIGYSADVLSSGEQNIAVGIQNTPQQSTETPLLESLTLPDGVELYEFQGLYIKMFKTQATQAAALEKESKPLSHNRMLVFPNIGNNAIVCAFGIEHRIRVYCYDEFMSRVACSTLLGGHTQPAPNTTRHIMEMHCDAPMIDAQAPVWQFLKNMLCGTK